MHAPRKGSFIDLCVRGEITSEKIDDYVDTWHADRLKADAIGLPLYDFLGMTWEEYKAWIQAPWYVEKIIRDHKRKLEGK